MRARAGRSTALCLPLAWFFGCATLTLPGGFEPVTKAPDRDAVAVAALEVVMGPDARPLQGRSRVGTGFLALIPLVPYGHQQLAPGFGALANSLETGDFLEDVAEVTIKDLRAAQLSRWVGTPADRLPGRDSGAAAYALHLTVEQGIYHRNLTLYGLSFAGAFLWMVGLPASYGSAELILAAELRDPEGTSLGSERFEGRASATEWLYYPAMPAYPAAMLRAYGQISPRLRAFVAERLRPSR